MPIPFPTDMQVAQKTSRGWLRDLLIPSSFDHDVVEDKFFGNAIWASMYPTAKTNGTSAAVTFTAGNANGFLELISGTSDDGYAGTGFSLSWTGDRGCLFECILRTPAAITTMKFEIGLTDATDDAGAINLKSTPSLTATDCAIIVFDTDDDTNLACVSAKAGVATATQDINTFPIAASTTYRFAVRVETDSVSYYMNGTQIAGHDNGIEGGTKLTPWMFVQARAGSASRTVQIHKWRMTQPSY